MSTNRTPQGRVSPAVYRRRRLVVLLGLVAVIVAIVLIVVRPGASQGEPASKGGPAAANETEAPPSSTEPATAIPTEPTAADGDPCEPDQVLVEAVTDRTEYAADQQPQLSVTITNTGTNACVLNAGTTAQVFTIRSGEEQYWVSTDCQTDQVDAEVLLAPGTPISSSVPIIWDRTRSSPDTCDQPREAVPAGGASYHLDVSVDGIESEASKQFMLF
ncbi:hypothetical protein FLP10_12205 [Agromyces intestinalis]|uniref:DUF4232 domain-containing protein n=1 Tax=Agromyces intestinalis TaxID=2592652 RepID=A0A5C1YJU5_9MICO|nr:hypothetical protein [Agromyces intestinalis]QEO15092.1 hypothetical protein FLP10_12205 [Agromyces intestinalis]